jgi:type IV pilus assembly protein PilW
MHITLMIPNTKQQRGYSLVELLVALSLGIILTSGLIKVFQGSKKSNTFSTELSRMQENARYALDLLAHDIRLIGYQGCADPASVVPNVIANPPPAGAFTISGLQAYKVTSSGISPNTLPDLYTDGTVKNHADTPEAFDVSAYALTNTDMIMMQFMNPLHTSVTQSGTHTTSEIKLTSNPNNFEAEDYIIVSDCETVDIFRANAVSNSSGFINLTHTTGVSGSGTALNTDNRLSKVYGNDAMVLRMENNLYFVAPSGLDKDTASSRTNVRGDTINSLYRANIDNEVDELVQGVDALVLLYGEKLASGNTRYYSANDSGLNLANVDSIKVGLLMHTIEGVSDEADAATYDVAGTDFAPTGSVSYDSSDHRIRRVFSTTVNLRNRR